jgi:hypothetical protein
VSHIANPYTYDKDYYCDRNIPIYRPWDRERRRKERGNYYYEQMLSKYDEECGECVVIQPAKEVN